MPNSVCLDASFVVRMLVGPEPVARKAEALWEEWLRAGIQICAPVLQPFEITNALYQYVRAGLLPIDTVRALLETALNLGIHLYTDPDLHPEALRLAHEMDLPATYDAHYLALARRLGAELWTADRRLVQKVAHRFPWVRSLSLVDGR